MTDDFDSKNKQHRTSKMSCFLLLKNAQHI